MKYHYKPPNRPHALRVVYMSCGVNEIQRFTTLASLRDVKEIFPRPLTERSRYETVTWRWRPLGVHGLCGDMTDYDRTATWRMVRINSFLEQTTVHWETGCPRGCVNENTTCASSYSGRQNVRWLAERLRQNGELVNSGNTPFCRNRLT